MAKQKLACQQPASAAEELDDVLESTDHINEVDMLCDQSCGIAALLMDQDDPAIRNSAWALQMMIERAKEAAKELYVLAKTPKVPTLTRDDLLKHFDEKLRKMGQAKKPRRAKRVTAKAATTKKPRKKKAAAARTATA